jgi:hypothetical protein
LQVSSPFAGLIARRFTWLFTGLGQSPMCSV